MTRTPLLGKVCSLVALCLAVYHSPTVLGYTTQEQALIFTQTNNNLLSFLYNLQPATEDAPPTLESFDDVEEGIWYEEAAKYVVEHEIMSGTSKNNFSPDMHLTRGLLATVITNAEKADLGLYPNIYVDIGNSWYRDSANWCAQNGIMSGYTPIYFAGNYSVNREQLSLVLFRYAQYCGLEPQGDLSILRRYEDEGDVPDYARESLAWALEHTLLLPKVQKLYPEDPATRGEIAYAIHQLLTQY